MGVGSTALLHVRILVEMLQSASVEATGATNDTVDNVALGQKEFSKI
jgi:hypothetical protein